MSDGNKDKPEISIDGVDQMNAFVKETHRFVTELHIELDALIGVFINRGLITKQELNASYQQSKQHYVKSTTPNKPNVDEKRNKDIDKESAISFEAQNNHG